MTVKSQIVFPPPPAGITMPERGLSSHRGSNRTHPENTLAAFRKAIDVGAHQIEMDIHLTDHGDLVIMHDRQVDRTTDGQGDIRRLSLDAIKRLDAGIRKDPRFAGEKIPTLDEALASMPSNRWLNLQLKGGGELGAAVARKVLEHRRLHQAFLAASREAADGARAAVPEIMICNLERENGNVERYIEETIRHGDAFIQLHHRHPFPAPPWMARLRQAGVRINYFGTNDPDALAGLYAAGIDFPLVDDLLPMMQRASELGMEPVSERTGESDENRWTRAATRTVDDEESPNRRPLSSPAIVVRSLISRKT